MTAIRQDDLIQSIADALQFISYYHPVDYIQASRAPTSWSNRPAAKDAIAQILINSRMCAEGHRPICQDTGIVNVFLKIGMDVRWEATLSDPGDGATRACAAPTCTRTTSCAPRSSPTRPARARTPRTTRRRWSTSTLVPGDTVEVDVAAKGGGSENKSKFVMLNPSDSIVDWVLKTVPTMGAGWCPPGMLGIGIGGTAEKAMLMAKEVLMEPIDMQELIARGAARPRRGTAHRTVREGQCAGHRRPGPGRPHHGAGRQDQGLPDPRRQPAGRHDPQLRRHAPRAFRARRLRPGGAGSAVPRRLAEAHLRHLEGQARQPGHGHARGSRDLAAGRRAAAQRQACSPAAMPPTSA